MKLSRLTRRIRNVKRRQKANRASLENLESRCLLTVGATFSAATGVLEVMGDDDPNSITVGFDSGGNVQVNGGDISIAGDTPTSSNLMQVSMMGAGGADVLMFDETNGLFPSSYINGGGGNDSVYGTSSNDTLVGGSGDDMLVGNKGNDQKIANAGDDLIVWNNGDGSDFMEGGSGDDQVRVNGADSAGDEFSVSPNSDRVRFERENLGLFQLDIGTTEDLEVNGQGGDDIIMASDDLEDLIALTFNGGDGDDYLSGSDGDDLLNGGLGNDTLIGNRGNDSKYGDEGDDLIVWNNGDGSDFMEGGDGSDQIQVNGADSAGDEFSVTSGSVTDRVQFNRTNLGLFQLDIGTTEDLEVNGQGGNDIITASDDLEDLIALTFNGGDGDDYLSGSDGDDLLNGGLGNDTLIGNRGDDFKYGDEGDDLIVWNNGDGSDLMEGGDGSDQIQVNGADAAGDEFSVSPGSVTDRVKFERENLGLFQLDIGTTEDLEVNGQGGDDIIGASEDLEDLIALTFNGGDGDDYLSGSDGDDLLNGGLGNDTLIGNRGDDFKYGDEGDDLIVWNNGDGSDFMEGGTGSDQVQVNGADAAGDEFSVTPGSVTDRVQFNRTNLGLFQLDIGTTEDLEVNGQGGDDIIEASNDLEDLIALTFNGGDGDDYLSGSDGDDLLNGGLGNDTLIGNRGNDSKYGDEGDDLIVWNNGDGSDFMEGGDGSDKVQVNGADAAGDKFSVTPGSVTDRVQFNRTNLGLFQLDIGTTEDLEVNGQGGDDIITASEDLEDLIALTFNGGDGDDYLSGSDGDDLLNGGLGNDTLIGNRGNDSKYGDEGDDLIVWNNGDGSDFMEGGEDSDKVQVNGADAAGDEFLVSRGSSTDRVKFERQNLGLFQLDIGTTEDLEVNGQGGDDIIMASDDLEDLIALTFNGGDGDDYLSGSDGDDLLNGGLGNDTLIGNKGNDSKYGDEGDDLIVWNNGDGSDLMEGGDGSDQVQVNGADTAGDEFLVSPGSSTDRVKFERQNLGLFQLDIGTTEDLEVNGQGGDDIIQASNDLEDLIALTFNGGDGDDYLSGSDGDDLLNGGLGNDTLIGNFGEDSKYGDEGDDLIIWNNGDGSDFIEGGEDFDSVAVYGSDSSGDRIDIDQKRVSGGDRRLQVKRRNLGRFTLDIGSTESVGVNGQGGKDRIRVGSVQRVEELDSVFVNGGDGNDFISGNGIGKRRGSGSSSSDQVSFYADGGDGRDLIFGSRNDDVLSGGDGNDRIFGLRGDDSIFGDDGNDRLFGGYGRDFIDGGDGFDVLFGGGHSDTGTNGERLFSISQP